MSCFALLADLPRFSFPCGDIRILKYEEYNRIDILILQRDVTNLSDLKMPMKAAKNIGSTV